VVVASAALALLLPLEVRAATICGVAILGMFALQRRWLTLISVIGLPIVAFALVSLAGVQFHARSSESTTDSIVARQFSTISVLLGGQAQAAAASGTYDTQDTTVDTVAWRLAWWNALTTDVTSSVEGTLFGIGFGTDLTAPFGLQTDVEDGRPLRSPHDFLLTVFARTGLVGVALWSVWIGLWLRQALGGIRAASRGGNSAEADYRLWLMVFPVAMIVAALFGVVLEGPYGAIPCYLLLGMSLRASAETVTVEEREPWLAEPRRDTTRARLDEAPLRPAW
jgi:hypothetical protein